MKGNGKRLFLTWNGRLQSDVGKDSSIVAGVFRFLDVTGKGVNAQGGELINARGFGDVESEDNVTGNGAIRAIFEEAVDFFCRRANLGGGHFHGFDLGPRGFGDDLASFVLELGL